MIQNSIGVKGYFLGTPVSLFFLPGINKYQYFLVYPFTIILYYIIFSLFKSLVSTSFFNQHNILEIVSCQ